MLQRSAREFVSPPNIAMAYAWLGRKTEAFAWLNKAIDVHDLFLPENFFDPLLDPLRTDPRYADVLKRMGRREGGSAGGAATCLAITYCSRTPSYSPHRMSP
jgi:hypothetical protein